ncbi:MAG: carbohydrate-binding protein [Clostridiales bacterium]|nr:carbohydrate-binding protein [Clostridiales bacterium]MCF8021663.1 carbohydrate-binding protein [Clostridiales bacterium]
MYYSQQTQGVVVDPMPITSGEVVTILYNGLLSASGAKEVYLRAGYGDSDSWYETNDYKMSKTGWGFVRTIEINDDSHLNICFRDNVYNWDNNNGINWSFEIHNGNQH